MINYSKMHAFMVIGLYLLVHSIALNAAWQIERADISKLFDEMTDRTIAVSSNGKIHFAYGGKHLYHAYYDGEWHKETVDSTMNVGMYASLALDSSGNAHISYYDETNRNLKYAYYDGSWHTETVGSGAGFTSLALDGSNNPHISYYDNNNTLLKYAYYDGIWHTETVDSNNSYMVYPSTSLALDSVSNPHISYYFGVSGDYDLKYAYYNGTWHTETIDSTGNVGRFNNSLALDAEDKAHISYYNGDLRYITNKSGTWIIETVDIGDAGRYSSLALDDNNNPHISYHIFHDSSKDDLKYAYFDGSWHTEMITNDADVRKTSLALDGSNRPYISYYSGNAMYGSLKYAYYDTSWHTAMVDEQGKVGENTSLALDGNNNPHISYQGRNQLKFAYYNGAWQTEVVDGTDYTGQSIAIDMDSNNNPHISYDDITGSLKYAWCDMELHTTWNIETVVSASGVDWSSEATSLVLDSNNNPHISYSYLDWPYDQDMIYTWCNRATGCIWQTEVFNDYGIATSLALDFNDNPHIAYGDNDRLHYSYYDGTWHSELVGHGGGGSLAIDSNGNPHIGYVYGGYHYNNLEYAYFNGSWHTEIVGGAGYKETAPFSCSLALDSADNTHISYYDMTNAVLKYAYYNGEWYIKTVDSDGDVGRYNSLALDSEGNPHISYYDFTHGDLKYATIDLYEDTDGDGIVYYADNCPEIPNGPEGGTCSMGNIGKPCTIPGDNTSECGASGYCSKQQEDADSDYLGDICDECTDTDGDGFGNPEFITNTCADDNCPSISNLYQQDYYPPQGNGIGDACECEGNFNCADDQDVDGSDAALFKSDFGRSLMNRRCVNEDTCNGDFNCDGDVDGTDASLFKSDFGRSSMQNPCPVCISSGAWCYY